MLFWVNWKRMRSVSLTPIQPRVPVPTPGSERGVQVMMRLVASLATVPRPGPVLQLAVVVPEVVGMQSEGAVVTEPTVAAG